MLLLFPNPSCIIAFVDDPGVAQLGSDATAAGGGSRELSEWPWSADDEGACHRGRCRVPQQEARLLFSPANFIPYNYPGVAQLVARLLWEQDAASSSLATWTKSPKFTFVDFGLLCL